MHDDDPTPPSKRNTREIIFDLEQLCQEEGFIYTFAFIVFFALLSSQEKMEEIDWSQRPNHRELSFLLGPHG